MKKNITIGHEILFKGIMLGMLLLLLLPITVLADETLENVVGFNYKIEYPKSQIRGENGYFDMELAPGTKETVKINISNNGEKNVTVNLSINGTKTNSNGILEYGMTDIENDKSLKFPFEKVVTAPEKIELKPGEIKQVPIEITMPETTFDGVILGGIQMKQAEVEEEKQEVGATVRNTYSYIVAMRIQNNQVNVEPEIRFNKAQGSQKNYRNSVVINLSNIKGSLINSGLDIESQIMKTGSDEVLYERKQTGMSIAPNSQMNFFVSMAGERMIPGDYKARVIATIGKQKWEETLEFTITKEDAEKYNKRDVGLVQDRGLNWKLIALIVGGVTVVIVVIMITLKIVKTNSKKEKRKSKSKNTSRKRTK